MKILRYILLFLGMSFVEVDAQNVVASQLDISNPSILMSDDSQVMVGMEVALPSQLKLSSNRVLVLTPYMKSADESYNKVLPSMYIYGRTRFIVDLRESDLPAQAEIIARRKNGTEQVFNYTTRLPYEGWMNGASLHLSVDVKGCADCLKEESSQFLTKANLVRYEVKPVVAFVAPEVEAVKNRSEQRRAYLDFPVNQTRIIPDFRNNPAELAKIREGVEWVLNDKNTTIQSIQIVGFASPEGRYAANDRLAQGRAQALKDYVTKEYSFESRLISASSVAEDWDGLRAFVEKGNSSFKQEMLSIIDNREMDFDAKENLLKRLDHGKVYAMLLQDAYPALRHSDYVIHYVVRNFNVDEAKQIIRTRPQQLSLQEMFMVAQTYPVGSDDFNQVFDVAVRMFPENPTANINAAAIELQRGDLQQAARYLDKSDTKSAAALNNQGVYKLLEGDLDAAESYFKRAKELGSKEADSNLNEVEKKRKDNALYKL